jgi:hypothetical protein
LLPGEQNQYCGTIVEFTKDNDMERKDCCTEKPTKQTFSFGDCDDKREGHGPAADAIFSFARSEAHWLSSFREAWMIATSNGFDNLTPLDPTYVL